MTKNISLTPYPLEDRKKIELAARAIYRTDHQTGSPGIEEFEKAIAALTSIGAIEQKPWRNSYKIQVESGVVKIIIGDAALYYSRVIRNGNCIDYNEKEFEQMIDDIARSAYRQAERDRHETTS